MSKKSEVIVRMYAKRHTSEVIVSGRLLGLVPPELYNGVLKVKNAGRKLFDSPTMPMSEFGLAEDVEGLRLAITAKIIDGEDVVGKKILFTEPLSFISQVQKDVAHIWMQSKGGDTIIVKAKTKCTEG